MAGTIRWNVWAGCMGFALIFLTSVSSNPFLVSLLRSIYGFAVLFLAFFLIRFACGILLADAPSASLGAPESEDRMKGNNIDLVTPPDDPDLNQMLGFAPSGEQASRSSSEDDFVPLEPTRLFRTDQQSDPEELARAIRHTLSKD